MEEGNRLPDQLEARRGGRAVVFIYIGIFLITAPIGLALSLPTYYLYIGIALLAVAGGSYLQPNIFRAAVIRATAGGLWTSKLGFVLWEDVEEIRLDKTRQFQTQVRVANVDVDLVFRTKDGRTATYNALYLHIGADLFYADLLRYWKDQSNHIAGGSVHHSDSR